jgi:flagellar M-ring protein FliF
MEQTLGFIRSMGPARLGAMMGLTIALVGAFVYVMNMMTQPTMSLLYSGLDPRDSSEIVGKLEGLKVQYQLKGDGTTILVPAEQALRLRMQLAGSGLPTGGSVGYEIFDRSDTFGQTAFVQNVNMLRALEGELARTIRSIDMIENARVHLNIPKHELFIEKQSDPTASVVIRARSQVNTSQVQAIQNLVASAVPGMKPGAVTIIDEKGILLGGGQAGTDDAPIQHDERQAAFEDRIRSQVESIVTSIVGPGAARVQVTADMDFNRITRASETFDPDGQVIRSTQTTSAKSNNQNNRGAQGVTVTNSLPAAAQSGAAPGAGSGSSATDDKTEETVNYEISHKSETEIQEGGRVKKLSVAVAVDGSYTTDKDGKRTYAARKPEEMQQIEQLVRSAIGYDEKRGDQLKVVNLPFNQPEPETLVAPEEPFMGLGKADYWQIAQFSGLGVISLLLIFFVARPLAKGLTAPMSGGQLALTSAPGGGAGGVALAGGAHQQAVGGPSHGALPAPSSNTGLMIDIAQVEGQVKESSVRKVGEIVAKHPDEATSIMRSWLHESA